MVRVIFILQIFYVGAVFADKFMCEKFFDTNLQVDEVPFCNALKTESLESSKVIGKVNFDNILLSNVLKKNNLGAIKVKFYNGNEKVIYRSAYLSGSPECINSLSKNNVKTVFNLYSGQLGYPNGMLVLENDIMKINGIPNYIQIRDYMVNSHKMSAQELNKKIVDIIKQISLANGNVLIHCYTGEHDTGVIFGVLNKCLNHASLKSIEDNTKCHTEYQSQYGITTYKKEMDIIRNFPCDLLSPNLF